MCLFFYIKQTKSVYIAPIIAIAHIVWVIFEAFGVFFSRNYLVIKIYLVNFAMSNRN